MINLDPPSKEFPKTPSTSSAPFVFPGPGTVTFTAASVHSIGEKELKKDDSPKLSSMKSEKVSILKDPKFVTSPGTIALGDDIEEEEVTHSSTEESEDDDEITKPIPETKAKPIFETFELDKEEEKPSIKLFSKGDKETIPKESKFLDFIPTKENLELKKSPGFFTSKEDKVHEGIYPLPYDLPKSKDDLPHKVVPMDFIDDDKVGDSSSGEEKPLKTLKPISTAHEFLKGLDRSPKEEGLKKELPSSERIRRPSDPEKPSNVGKIVAIITAIAMMLLGAAMGAMAVTAFVTGTALIASVEWTVLTLTIAGLVSFAGGGSLLYRTTS